MRASLRPLPSRYDTRMTPIRGVLIDPVSAALPGIGTRPRGKPTVVTRVVSPWLPSRRAFLIGGFGPSWEGLRILLSELPHVTVVGDASSMAEARQQVIATCPDTIVSATAIHDESTVPLLAELYAQLPGLSVVLLAGRHSHDELEHYADLHIAGYFQWADINDPAFPYALISVISGTFTAGSREVAVAYISARRGYDRAHEGSPFLTPRERIVLQRCADGMTREQIAQTEHLSRSTVDRTIVDLFEKLGVSSSGAMIASAVRRRLLL